MAKQIVFDEEVRHALKKGIDTLADAVRVTLGPRGHCVALDKKWGAPSVIDDGVTIAKDIELPDPFENMGVQMVKEAATKTNDACGDGTTTSTILAHAIISGGFKNVAAGADALALKRGIQKATAAVIEELKKASTEVKDKEQIAQVGTITAKDKELILRESYRETEAVRIVRQWWKQRATEERPILVLCGGTGAGKTMACALAIVDHGKGVAIESQNLPKRVDPWTSEIIAGAREVDLSHSLIVLDDLGTEGKPPGDRWSRAFHGFVSARLSHGRTLITTNLKRAEFRQRYDARVIDRLNSGARAIELTGQSLRKGGAGL